MATPNIKYFFITIPLGLFALFVFLGIPTEQVNPVFKIPKQTISCPEYAMRGEIAPYNYCK